MDKITLKFNTGFQSFQFNRNGVPNNLALQSDQVKLSATFGDFLGEYPQGLDIELQDLSCLDGDVKKLQFTNFDKWYLKVRSIEEQPSLVPLMLSQEDLKLIATSLRQIQQYVDASDLKKCEGLLHRIHRITFL